MRKPFLLTLLSATLILAVFFAINQNPRVDLESKKVPELRFAEKKSNDGAEIVQEEKDQPGRAQMEEFEMTKDPALGYPPLERKIHAAAYIRQKLAEQSRLPAPIGGVEWTARGPNDIGGRSRAMMFDPNDQTAKRVFSASTTGGLFTNDDVTNPAVQWQPVTTITDNLTISSITYDPSNTQVMYIGTGAGLFSFSSSRGEGMWKSTDGGVNWTQLPSAMNSDFHFVNQVRVTNQGTVLAATSAGFFRSTDGGTTWVEQFSEAFGDIEITSDHTIYASQGFVLTDGGIFKSVDDGATWTSVTPTPTAGAERIELASAPSDPNVIYAVASLFPNTDNDVAWFRKSEDAGETWTDITIPLQVDFDCTLTSTHFTRRQAWFDLTLAVHPTDPNTLIAGAIDLHRTTDGGETWEPISYWVEEFCPGFDYIHPDHHEFLFRPGHPNEAISASDGGVFYSPDMDNPNRPVFEQRNKDYNTTQLYSVAMANEVNSNFYLAGAQDNGTIRYSTPGQNKAEFFRGGDGIMTFIDKDNSDIAIASFPGNDYTITTDGGATFSDLITSGNTGRFVNPADYDQNAKVLYTAGDDDQYMRVTNITTTPSTPSTIGVSLGGNQISAIKVSPYTENRIFVGVDASGSQSKIFMIDNADQSFPQVTDITGTFEGSPGVFLSSIDVGASDDQLLITFTNYGTTSVYETTDGGTNWINKEGNLPDIPVRWCLYNPNNRDQVLLATEMGIWSTDNLAGTPEWSPTNNGLASVRTNMIRYREVDQQIAVASYGRGLYTSNVFANTSDANFTSSATVGYVGKPVQFEDVSLLPGNQWAWNFGDGQTSDTQNPIHVYNTPGVYSVTLDVAGGGGAKTEQKENYILILAAKSTPYGAGDGGDFESGATDWASRAESGGVDIWERGLPLNALNTPPSGSNVWKTDLDADVADPGFNYTSALYSPVFDLSDNTKDYDLNFSMSMETPFCNAPMALKLEYSTDLGATWKNLGEDFEDIGSTNWFFRAPDQGCQIDYSLYNDFTGWAGAGQTDVLTSHPLNELAGQGNVSFRFLFGLGSGWTSGGQPIYNSDGFMIDDFSITKTGASADFHASQLFTYEGEDVQFTYQSNGATSFSWNFGDGMSTDRNPVHAFESPGVYNVTLTINSPDGQAESTQTVHVLPKILGPMTLDGGGDFESNFDYFAAENLNNTPFERGQSEISGKDGTASGSNAWVTDLDAAEYLNNSRANLYTPAFAFNILGEYLLEFKAKYQFEPDWDGFIVEYTTDFGNTWTKLNDVIATGWYNSTSDPQNQIFGANNPIFSGDNFGGSFTTFSTDVSDLFPNEYVAFRFVFRSDGAAVDVGLALDDFRLVAPVPGPAVASFTAEGVTGCSGQQVTFTSTSTGTITSLSWDFGANATPQSANGAGPHTVVYSGDGTSDVVLTAVSPVNGTVMSEATQISTAPTFDVSFTQEDTGNRNTKRLVASPDNGDAYQWFLAGDPIDGATDATYTADEKGFYSVAVTVGGCTITSSNLNVITEIEDDPAFNRSISFYPNPVSDIVTVKMANSKIGKVSLAIYDLNGKLISQSFVDKNNFEAQYELSMGGLEKNTYLLEIISDDSRSVKRVVKD